ncbi:MAG: AAA family ATPase [bacterium]
MIDRISIENYKSIRELKDFELKPINVLIGANGSGKSNFLDVFAFLRDTLHKDCYKTQPSGNPEYLMGALMKRGEKDSLCFFGADFFQISFSTHAFLYSIKIGWKPPPYHSFYIMDEKFENKLTDHNYLKRENDTLYFESNGEFQEVGNRLSGLAALFENIWTKKDDSVKTFGDAISNFKIYDRINTAPGSPVRTPQEPKGDTILDEDAGNLADVLNQMSQNSEVFERQLERLLKVIFPDFKRISFPVENGNLLISWENTQGYTTKTAQLSDGMLKFLSTIAILRNPHLPPLIGIDEPDAKLHPRMHEIFADMIREASEKSQIIITTHNPDFVTFFEPEDILILVLHKGETEIRRFSDKGALDLWLENFTKRELWLMGELESRW